MNKLSRGSLLAAGAGFLAAGALDAASAQTSAPLKLGVGMVEANAQGYYGADAGFFKQARVNVEIQQMRAGTAIAAAIAGGSLQAGVSNVVSLGAAHQRGIPFVIIAPGAYYDAKYPTAAAVVAPNSPIKSGKDLEGKVIGGISVGGLDQVAMWAYVDKSGGDVGTLKYVEVTNGIIAEALAQGRIASASMNDPELSEAVAQGRVKILGHAWNAISPLFMQTAWFTTRDWLEKNKDTARRLQQALVAAGNWGMKNSTEGAAILAKYIGSKEQHAIMRFGDKLDPRFIQPVFDAGAKYKILPPTTAADFIWDGK
ncbi:MAG TPA: ABC transporter substrate-binding protein [Candidatus Acidoferrales bacterium]|nr:ABC transporter substrate-binding protein [Candidatus Acidoferrales bacterium]